MKKIIAFILSCLIISALFSGCGKQKAQTTTIGNPWSSWNSIEEAQRAAGFLFGLPEVIGDTYTATAYRTLNNELIEVIYHDGDYEVRVRKQKGEGQDISGDYNTYDTCTEESVNGGVVTTYQDSGSSPVKQLISYKGYSWSFTASNGFWGDSNADFLNLILDE